MESLFGVMIFHTSIVNRSGGYMYPQYMCILLYMIVIWCNGISEIYFQLEWGLHVSSLYVHSAICDTFLVYQYSIDVLSIGVGGICILSICAFCYRCHLFGVMVFQRSIVNWSGGYMYPQYMCILLYVILMLCNGIPYIYCQLEWGIHVSSVYVHSVICVTDLV